MVSDHGKECVGKGVVIGGNYNDNDGSKLD